MPSIKLLPNTLVEKIAAGEVIERPASIVKELLENSIDAGATRVEIRLGEGGKAAISVSDDGCGIPVYEAPLALKSHATSKIFSLEDLIKVRTYGFRGEALSSIAAVSQLDLLSRTGDSPMGIRIRSEGGTITKNEPYGMPRGTTVSVAQLFYNTPARRKFLKSAPTEFGYIDTVIRRAALGLIEHEFYVENEGEIVLHVPAASNLRERLVQLYGKEVAEKTVLVEGKDGPLDVSGYVTNSHHTFGRATEIWLFVNGRPVKDRMLQSALMEGFRSALMERRYPLAVINVTIPTELVDVNVHPSKTEVRFSDAQPVFRLLSKAVATSLNGGVMPIKESRKDWPSASFIFPTPNAPFSSVETTSMTARTAAAPYLAFDRPKGPFSSLLFFGSLDNTYLLFRNDTSLIVIDQHAAHERVLFERLQDNFKDRKPKIQRLLMPLTMEISAQAEARLLDLQPMLETLGFELEPFGTGTWVIKGLPEGLESEDPRPLLKDLTSADETWNDRVDDLVARVACHSAIRAHDPLTFEEIRELLVQMDSVNLASNCPHGRPTFLRFTLGDLERLFHRK